MLSARSAASAARAVNRSLQARALVRPVSVLSQATSHNSQRLNSSRIQARAFSNYTPRRIKFTSDSPESQPSSSSSSGASDKQAADISDAEYHELSDQYMNTLQLALEEAAEGEAQKNLEVEFSVSSLFFSLVTSIWDNVNYSGSIRANFSTNRPAS